MTKTTRLARLHGVGDVRLDVVPAPTPGPRDAVVRIHASGICGTDLSYVRRGGLIGPGEPLALGHEASGVVAEVGSDVRDVAVGDRVVIHPMGDDTGRMGGGGQQGALADLVLVAEADRYLLRVPDELDLTTAALVEPVGVGMNAAQRLELEPGDTAVVVGCGPIGLAAIATLRDAGIESVLAVDPGPERRDLAVALGAEAALDPADPTLWRQIGERHGRGEGDLSRCVATTGFVEASGNADMLRTVIARAGLRARISLVAVYVTDEPVSLLSIMFKELELRGSMEYPARFADALDLLLRRDLSAMVTDVVPPEEVVAALADPARVRQGGKMLALFGAER